MRAHRPRLGKLLGLERPRIPSGPLKLPLWPIAPFASTMQPPRPFNFNHETPTPLHTSTTIPPRQLQQRNTLPAAPHREPGGPRQAAPTRKGGCVLLPRSQPFLGKKHLRAHPPTPLKSPTSRPHRGPTRSATTTTRGSF